MFGRRPNSDQARICVLGFRANRVWLVSHFFLNFSRFLEGKMSEGKYPGEYPTLLHVVLSDHDLNFQGQILETLII